MVGHRQHHRNAYIRARNRRQIDDLPLAKPFCAGQGLTWGPGPKGKGVSFKPAAHLVQPWIAFQGLIDQVCSPADVQTLAQGLFRPETIALTMLGNLGSLAVDRAALAC